jgi:hypothetical protein
MMNKLRKRSTEKFHLQQPQKNPKLGINLTKEVKDLYIENYKTLKKLKKAL